MKPEFNPQQTNWISQVEELDDIEASQVNGGFDPGLAAAQAMQAQAVAFSTKQAEASAKFQAEMAALNAANAAAKALAAAKSVSPGQ